MSDFTGPDNPYNPKARIARDVRRSSEKRNKRAWVRRFHEARAVACDAMNIKYKPIPVPATALEQAAFGHKSQQAMAGDTAGVDLSRVQRNTLRSWEILTERSGG